MWQLFPFVLVNIGAVVFWLLKGMKTTFEFESSRRTDNDLKYYRNLLTGLFIFIAAFVIIEIILRNR